MIVALVLFEADPGRLYFWVANFETPDYEIVQVQGLFNYDNPEDAKLEWDLIGQLRCAWSRKVPAGSKLVNVSVCIQSH